jgi:DNA (cytosine-5)-methyltransferase 1
MRYASVCDGIGAVHVAWQPLGWECAWTSEIEPFPAAVVEHRYGFTNLGDMTKITEEMLHGQGPVELLVGGTPCQSFSRGGLQRGLEDPRGNLALRFVQLAQAMQPKWVVWENVPGVLRTNGGRDFGSIIGALAELGFGVAYRVLDAKFFGVPQRRRRVFVVACLGDWDAPRSVLFDDEGRGGDFKASPIKGNHDCDGREGDLASSDSGVWWDGSGVSQTLDAVLYKKQCLPEKNRFPAVLAPAWVKCECCDDYVCQVHGCHAHECSCGAIEEWADADASPYDPCLLRYITPTEAERLMGFPDGHTDVPFRNKRAADSPRYRALGNSMAVPCMAWLGYRIHLATRHA